MDGWRDRAAIVLPLLGAVVLIVSRAAAPARPMDEGIPVVYGDLVLRGFVPHRDFQSFYGPGIPWLVAGSYAVLGTSVASERLVGALLRLALVAGVTLFARRWGWRSALATGLLASVELVPLPVYASAALAATASAVWSTLLVSRRDDRVAVALAGTLAAVVLLFRVDYILIAIAPAFLTLRTRSAAARRAYCAGLVLGAIPLAVHAAAATPAALFNDLVVDALRAVPSRRLPLPPAELDVALVFDLVLVSLAAALSYVIWKRVRRSGRADDPLAAYVLLAVFLLPQVLGRADREHLATAACVTVPLFVFLVARLSDRVRIGAGPRLAALLAVVTIYVTTAIGLLALPSVTAVVARGARSYPDDLSHAPQIDAIVHAARSYVRPGMRLFVGPRDLTHTNYNDTILYFLFPDLIPATRYLEMEPRTANRPGSPLAADIASADLLILTTRWDGVYEPNDSAIAGSDEPGRVVDDEFQLVARDGQYALYLRVPR